MHGSNSLSQNMIHYLLHKIKNKIVYFLSTPTNQK